MDPITLRMVAGVSRICGNARSILDLGISTFPVAVIYFFIIIII